MIDQIPKSPGAYILHFEIQARFRLDISTLDYPQTEPGVYAYCGSANGPGGLRARIARHLRPDKPIHWHIDRLTALARITAIAYSTKFTECALFEQLRATNNATIPIPGFGSSDCRRCPAHLARIDIDPAAKPGVPAGTEIAVLCSPD